MPNHGDTAKSPEQAIADLNRIPSKRHTILTEDRDFLKPQMHTYAERMLLAKGYRPGESVPFEKAVEAILEFNQHLTHWNEMLHDMVQKSIASYSPTIVVKKEDFERKFLTVWPDESKPTDKKGNG